VRLGRVTQWQVLDDDVEAPIGQKLLLVDGEEFPILELRELTITSAAPPLAD
jgi:type VI secretion system protein ImpE